MNEQDLDPNLSAEDLVEKIHDIQEEIFLREDQIDELLDSSESQEPLQATVERGKNRRRYLHLRRLRSDWDRMVEQSREANSENDFELAAALVHFIGDILISQPQGIDAAWIARLQRYLKEDRTPVN